MSETYTQQAESNCLSLTLTDLGISKSSNYVKKEQIKDFKDLFFDLVTCTPTDQSHAGAKFKKKLGNQKDYDCFLSSLFSDLEINQTEIFLYETYIEGMKKRNKLNEVVLKCSEKMLCLRCDNGVVISLYMAVRNALAHGDILEQDGYIVLYSVRDAKNEYGSDITFFLRIRGIEKLEVFKSVLEQYKESLIEGEN